MVGRLDGKVALITGGARGQGEAEARLFVAEGASVMLGDVLEAEAEVLAKELGDKAASRHHDVTDEDAWQGIVADTIDAFGPIDILVNNAGIFKAMPLTMMSRDDYERVIQINQVGVFLGMKTVAPGMAAAKSGSIINISSIAGLRGSGGTIAYTASKFAVRGMTKVAAVELAPFGVRVNSIHPGIIETPMLNELTFGSDDAKMQIKDRIPNGRIASADDVAKLALYLASDDSSYSTGAEFVVDGGMTARL